MNSAHVAWLHHSKVYHRRGWVSRPGYAYAACGVLVSCDLYRCQWGTEHGAALLGLRRCGRCWRRTDAGIPPGAL